MFSPLSMQVIQNVPPNDSKDRTLFDLINKALLFCLTVHKTIDNEHSMYVQYLNRISFVFFDDNHNHSVHTVILF